MNNRLFESILHNKKVLVGTCVNSFDEDGDCIVDQLPWNTVSDFALDEEENFVEIDVHEFAENCEYCIPKQHFKFYKLNDGKYYIAYNRDTDVHYFYA
jgi:hypothetical protein